MSENSINHHFVPQGLLKNWYASHSNSTNKGFRKYKKNFEGNIELDKRVGSAKSNCSEEHLNTTYKKLFLEGEDCEIDTNTIEDKLAKLDDKAIKVIQKILLNNSFADLNYDEKKLLSQFVVSIHMRHPDTINSVMSESSEKAGKALNIIKKLAEDIGRIQQIEHFKRNFTLSSMLSVLNEPETYLRIARMKWLLIEAEGIEFFTGEKPLVANLRENERELKFGFGLALSPSVLFVGLHTELFKDKLEEEAKVIQNFAITYNICVCKQSKYVITTKELSKDHFELFIKDNLAPL